MNANPNEGRRDEARRTEAVARSAARGGGDGAAAARGSGRRGIVARNSQYMIAPAAPGGADTALIERLDELGGFEIVRTIASRPMVGPPVAVVRTTPEKIAALRQAYGDVLVVELDRPLRAASAAMSAPASRFGAMFATTIQVLGDTDKPIERAEVQLIGRQSTAEGISGGDGKVELTLHGELPETVMELIVKPSAGYWGLWRSRPYLQAETANMVMLRPLADVGELSWGGPAMRFDRLAPEYRGAGVKIALIDSGVATSHGQLRHVQHGFDAARGDERSWSKDQTGHGTLAAGIIAAQPDTAGGIRGYAPEAELHACKLPLDACCSDLVAALDDCLAAGIDIACVGYGCERGSTIVEQRIVAAKQRGLAVIAAAGSNGGRVQFPACSPHVLAVGAVGQIGTFPEESPEAAYAASATALGGGLFVPAFSCAGPELDLCAPGVAVVSCGSPDGYAIGDGASLAVPHVAALAALTLAHQADFRRDFAGHDAERVGRLFQILKATAQPLGNPMQTGAGLPVAPRALGLQSPLVQPFSVPLDVALQEMRGAMHRAGILASGQSEPPEPPRGPAGVTHRPLSVVAPAMMGAGGNKMGMRDLKAAMQLAGLSGGR
jgi:subtilisin